MSKMRVSFDLDEVLFVSPDTFETEPPLRFPYNLRYKERLRKGTPALIHELQKQGFEVWVYTSSFRTEAYIRGLFRAYGVQFDQIVNGDRHIKEVQRGRRDLLPQKMPPFYHISLHIDDEDVIVENGRRFGYRVLKVCDPDPDWAGKILAEAGRIRDAEEKVRKIREERQQNIKDVPEKVMKKLNEMKLHEKRTNR